MLLVVKNLPANAGDSKRCGFDPWVRKILWRMAQQPTPVFLPGESHGQEEPSKLVSMGSQRVQHDLVTKQQQHCPYFTDEKTEAQKDLTLAKSQDSGHLSRKPIGLTPHQKTLAASAWGMGKSFFLFACLHAQPCQTLQPHEL